MAYGLGRRAAKDERDAAYPMRAAIQRGESRLIRHWTTGWVGDQGLTSQCVGYSAVHWLECSPTRHSESGPIIQPSDCYRGAQDNDEWAGNDYEGSSVRGAFKWLQKMGRIGSYRWAQRLEDVVDWLLYHGPVVVGTDWYSDDFEPDAGGVMSCTGIIVGGHAYLIEGVNLKRGMARVVNSWGRVWGENGRAWIRLDDLERLVFQQDGECVCATEQASG